MNHFISVPLITFTFHVLCCGVLFRIKAHLNSVIPYVDYMCSEQMYSPCNGP